QYSSVALDETGNILAGLESFLLDIDKYNLIYDFSEYEDTSINLSKDLVESLLRFSKFSIKQKISQWKQEIKKLNDKIFKLEMNKKEKIYNYNKKAQMIKLESLKRKLEQKINQRPTDRQKSNIAKLDDEKRKQERKERYRRLEEEILVLEHDIKVVETV
ncbi:MAG: hypothetical protein P8Y23_15715, partial [Candidatus Lokiarchaeota archaeon]